jgi:hypothetical protein
MDEGDFASLRVLRRCATVRSFPGPDRTMRGARSVGARVSRARHRVRAAAVSGEVPVIRVVNATVVLRAAGGTILTDPYFDARWFLPLSEPIGLTVAELLPLDVILGVTVSSTTGSRSRCARSHTGASPRLRRAIPHGEGSPLSGLREGRGPRMGRQARPTDQLCVTLRPRRARHGMKTNAYLVSNIGITGYIGA